jgi:preprotein translocase subunit SecF
MLIGVVVGTYSSVFVATPLAYDAQQLVEKRKLKK